MPVSFSHIPANIRVPLFYAEVSNELAGHQSMLQPGLIIGPALTADPAIINTPILISSNSMAYETFGAGSVIADMINTYRQNDQFDELWAIAVDPGNSSGPARGGLAITGQATAGGTLPLYIGGDLYRIGVSVGATGESVAETLADEINADPFGLVTATAGGDIALSDVGGGATLELVAKQPGEIGNGIDIGVALRGLGGGEMVPPGLSVRVAPMADGAGIPDLAPALEAMGDRVYDYIGVPYSDTASLDAVQRAMDDVTGRWAWNRQVYGHVFTAREGTLQELHDFGRTRNDQHVSLLGFPRSASPPWRRAAALTAVAARGLRGNGCSRPLQTLPLLGVVAPQRRDEFNQSHRQSLLYAGIAVEEATPGGGVQISRCITTYQRNAWGQPDPSYLDVTTPATVQYFIRFLRQRLLQKFPRHKLADDGTSFGPGQAIVTPRIIKAEIVAAYLDMVDEAVVENVDSFKELLIVERDPADPNRVNVLASPDLVNQLRVLAMLVAFRLRTAQQALAVAA